MNYFRTFDFVESTSARKYSNKFGISLSYSYLCVWNYGKQHGYFAKGHRRETERFEDYCLVDPLGTGRQKNISGARRRNGCCSVLGR